MIIWLFDFVIFILLLLSIILTPLVSLPFFPKILSDQTLFSQFVFVFTIFLAFLLYLLRSLFKPLSTSPHPSPDRRGSSEGEVVKSFALFVLIIFAQLLFHLKPVFSFSTKQFSLANIDTLLPGLSGIALFFLFLLLLSNPFISKLKKFLFPVLFVLSFLSILNYLYFYLTSPIPHLSLINSWQIAVREISTNPLLGTGPGQFVTAFNKFRPLELNVSPFWQYKFTSSGNEYLDILTTTGLLGFGAYVLFLAFVLKMILTSPFPSPHRRGNTKGEVICSLSTVICSPAEALAKAGLLFFVILAFFLPFSLTLRMSFMVLVGLVMLSGGWRASNLTSFRGVDPSLSRVSDAAENFWQGDDRQDPPWLWLAGPARVAGLILITIFLFFLSNYFRAELSYSQALSLLNQNPQQAYQKNLEAINFFTFKDSYHLTLSQISLAWANALAQNTHLTQEEKTLVGQLLGQAINQAKLSVTLAPNKSASLENLGLIYKNLIGVASDADRWSLAAFNNASGLDPANPLLQLEIGGVYFVQKNYEQASRFFQNALLLKPNYANGYYNYALAQHALGKTQPAKDALKQAISLTTPGSADFMQAQKQLSAWENE